MLQQTLLQFFVLMSIINCLLASYILFLVYSGTSELFWGQPWCCQMNLEYLKSKVILVLKLSLFTKTTKPDKFKLRFETLFSCLSVPSEIIFLVIRYRVYISNTLLPSNCFHSVFRIANEGDQLSKLSLSIMYITLNHV